jgi:hypothetical protein
MEEQTLVTEQVDLIEAVKAYAIERHAYKRSLYDEMPYEVHLKQVVDIAKKWMKKYISEADQPLVEAACWAHDLEEECAEKYYTIVHKFNKELADLLWDITDEVGKGRRDIHYKTYPKIAKNKLAIFIKMCDRFANTTYSKIKGSSMFDKYVEEYKHLKMTLQKPQMYPEFWKEMDELHQWDESEYKE